MVIKDTEILIIMVIIKTREKRDKKEGLNIYDFVFYNKYGLYRYSIIIWAIN